MNGTENVIAIIDWLFQFMTNIYRQVIMTNIILAIINIAAIVSMIVMIIKSTHNND